MTDTSTTTPTAAATTNWLPNLASITTWKHVAAVALAVIAGLAYFDKLPAWPSSRPDTVLQTQLDGLGGSLTLIEDRIKQIEDTAAAKPDIAEVRARLAVIESKTKTGLMTGSISKKR